MASGELSAREYIARAATARVVYVAVYRAAVWLMPPLGDADIECHYTVKDLATLLDGQTASTIRNELTWLANWGWLVNRKRSLHFLGRREGFHQFLKADLAAFMVTREERLVSREILGIEIKAPPTTTENVARGATRVWHGTETEGGAGELVFDDLGS